MYLRVAHTAGLDPATLEERVPVGASGQRHNLLKRSLRWFQQSMRMAGVIEHVPGQRGIWQLTHDAGHDLSKVNDGVAVLGFSTDLGVAILGSCDTVFSRIDVPVTLMVTSPPFPIAKGRAYGRVPLKDYEAFIVRCLEPLVRAMLPGASIMLHLGCDVFEPGACARSTYVEETVVALRRQLGLYLVDRYTWIQNDRAPGPVRYASIDRVMLHGGHDTILHLTNDPSRLLCRNDRVLTEHTARHLKLMAAGGERRRSSSADGAHGVRPGSFGRQTTGKIPRNVLFFGHNCASQRAYKRRCAALGLRPHGAPMPLALARFLVEYGSEPGEVVADIFGGSQTTPLAAEQLGRRWISTETCLEYVLGGATWFEGAPGMFNPLAA